MKKEFKNAKNAVEYTTQKQRKNIVSVVRYTLPTKILSVRGTKLNMFMFVSSCAICGKKKLRFIKNQEVSRLLNIPL